MNNTVYPVILVETRDKKIPWLVYIPDFDSHTQGKNLADAIYMARDAISLLGVTLQDEKKQIPKASRAHDIDPAGSPWHGEKGIISETVSLIPVDFDSYRKKLKNLSVRRNVTLPAWLNEEAEKAGINVSAILQEALKERLQLV